MTNVPHVFHVRRKMPPHHTFLVIANSSDEIRDSLKRRHEARPPPDGKINQVLGKSNKEILKECGMLGHGVEDYEIVLLTLTPSDLEVKMLNDDWGTATLTIDGEQTESALLNLA